MEQTNDYIANTVKAKGNAAIGDVASIIALAILEADGDYEAAIGALERAKKALFNLPIGKQAAECFDEAIYHVTVFKIA